MGNTWNYEIVFQKELEFTADLFKRILALASRHGYTLRYPVYVVDANGNDLQFHDAESLTAYMCSKGGCFPIWRDNLDILLCYLPSERGFSFGIQYRLLPERDQDIVRDLEAVFSTFCNELQPYFAYSHDEWATEWAIETTFPKPDFLTAWGKVQNSIAQHAPPLLLYWLNYFDQPYFESIGEWRFKDLNPHKIARTASGVYLYLASAPWGIKLAQLGADGQYHIIEDSH